MFHLAQNTASGHILQIAKCDLKKVVQLPLSLHDERKVGAVASSYRHAYYLSEKSLWTFVRRKPLQFLRYADRQDRFSRKAAMSDQNNRNQWHQHPGMS